MNGIHKGDCKDRFPLRQVLEVTIISEVDLWVKTQLLSTNVCCLS